jgi:DNA polymerase IV
MLDFPIHNWPTAILHLDGNAFFASVMQAVKTELKGKPVIVGAERGIATAISYEAKAYGVKRGMNGRDIKKLCPLEIFVKSDYELFSLYSQKMFALLRQFSPLVEEYSIDEGFADMYGLRRPLHGSYQQIALRIQKILKDELDLPISVGVSLTKSLAKLASGFKKPMGITIVSGKQIKSFLARIPLNDIWGIGPATTSYLQKYGLKTALDLVSLNSNSGLSLNKNHREIIQELQGKVVYALNPNAKNTYKSISKTHTFTPPSKCANVVWAELFRNTENAFKKARLYGYFVKRIIIFLKTQEFKFVASELTLNHKEKYPLLIRKQIKTEFEKLFKTGQLYRATGCVLTELSESGKEQAGLFDNWSQLATNKTKNIYQALEKTASKVDFGASLWLNKKKENKKPLKQKVNFNLPVMEI